MIDNYDIRAVRAERDAIAAELAETQRQLKLVAPVGRYNGRNIEEWANYGAALEAALHQYWNAKTPAAMGAADAVAAKLLTQSIPAATSETVTKS